MLVVGIPSTSISLPLRGEGAEPATDKGAEASAMQVANVSKPFLRMRFGGLLRPAELGFEEFCIEMTSI